MQQPDFTQLKKKVVVKIAISSFVIQFLALYSSEIFNGLYNVQLNALGLSLVERLPHFFKPTIMGVFLAAYLFQLTVMFVTLRPMFQYLQTGERYGQARVAAIKLPWRRHGLLYTDAVATGERLAVPHQPVAQAGRRLCRYHVQLYRGQYPPPAHQARHAHRRHSPWRV